MSRRRSDIETAMRCMRWLQLREGVPPSDPMRFGNVIHSLLYQYGQHCLKTNQDTDLSKFDALVKADKHKSPPDMLADYDYTAGALRSDPVLIFRHRKTTQLETTLAVDGQGNGIDPDSENAVAHATLDRFTIAGEEARIIDYKTNRKVWNQGAVDSAFQAKFYSALVLANYPNVMEVKFTFCFVRYRAQRSVEYTRFDLDGFFEDVVFPTIKRIDNASRAGGEWPRTLGEHCQGCDSIDKCGLFADDPPDFFNADEFDDESLTSVWTFAGALRTATQREIARRLKAGAELRTPDGKRLEYCKKTTYQYPYRAVKNALLGVLGSPDPIADEIRFSDTTIQRLLKKAGGNTKSFREQYAVETISTKLEAR